MNREAVETEGEEKNGASEPISLKIPSRAEYVLLARLIVSQLGELAGFEQQDVYDLKLAITEAATNVIRHAKVDSFEIEYRVLPDAVEISVIDAGDGFEADDFLADSDPQGGFGLAVIRSLVDDVTLESTAGGGTLLRMIRSTSSPTSTKTS